MQTDAVAAPISKGALWAGWIMTALPALFLLVDGGAKLARPEPVVQGTLELGYTESVIVPLGIVLLLSLVVHLIPQTAMLGAILLTGYLGGAVASHVRLSHPWATHILFPVYFGVLIWGGLYLRDQRVSAVVKSGAQGTGGSKKMFWAGWIIAALAGLLLVLGGGMKVARTQQVVDGFTQMGYPDSSITGIGLAEALGGVLYLIPQTAVFGAILLTGFLGGATATHVQTNTPFLTPVAFGVLLWLGLYLRDPRVRSLVPLRRGE